ncbi:MAG: penicillin-binding protein 2 [Chloroflexota bacterium]|nr:penicillin-binding protein 2 [Chloroflexota bacterium]
MQIITTFAGFTAFAILGLALVFTDRLTSNQWLLVLVGAWVLLLIASRIRLPQRLPTFNRSLIQTTLVLATVFIMLSVQLVRVQIVDSDVTYSRTAVAPDGEILGNPRVATSELSIERGEIFDRNGAVIAETEREGDIYIRTYPDPATSYVAGYYSPLLYGSAGLESAFNDELTGEMGNEPLDRTLNSLLNRPQQGADLRLTLDRGLQQQAMNLMGTSNGSVVVMDAETGEVIVLASNPNYDPNRIFTASTKESDEASEYWESLIENDDAPLVLRATLGLFTPGSTFKTITAAIGLELGLIESDEVFEDNGALNIDGRILIENNRPDASRDQWTVREGIAWSLNVVFAQIGLRIGGNDLWNSGQALGFGEEIPFDLPVAESQIAGSREFLEDDNAVADTAFGQGQLLVTPLHMCIVTAMYVNDGEMMQPYLVDAVVDENGRATRETDPARWLGGISPETASQVEGMMVNAVENGTVTRAQVDGYTVGGKTGTAETGDGSAHSWFIGFIGESGSRYAVAVVLEQGSGGLADAVTIGRDILSATITSPGPQD